MEVKKVGLYAGSFDPFTNGHLHVIKTSANIFDKVVVDIGINDQKSRHYNSTRMKEAIEQVFLELGIDNVEVIIYDGLTSDLAREVGATMLIRGIRDSIDLANEENIADFNYRVSEIDTIYVRAGVAGSISSSMVRELLKYDKDIDDLVPGPVLNLIKQTK